MTAELMTGDSGPARVVRCWSYRRLCCPVDTMLCFVTCSHCIGWVVVSKQKAAEARAAAEERRRQQEEARAAAAEERRQRQEEAQRARAEAAEAARRKQVRCCIANLFHSLSMQTSAQTGSLRSLHRGPRNSCCGSVSVALLHIITCTGSKAWPLYELQEKRRPVLQWCSLVSACQLQLIFPLTKPLAYHRLIQLTAHGLRRQFQSVFIPCALCDISWCLQEEARAAAAEAQRRRQEEAERARAQAAEAQRRKQEEAARAQAAEAARRKQQEEARARAEAAAKAKEEQRRKAEEAKAAAADAARRKQVGQDSTS